MFFLLVEKEPKTPRGSAPVRPASAGRACGAQSPPPRTPGFTGELSFRASLPYRHASADCLSPRAAAARACFAAARRTLRTVPELQDARVCASTAAARHRGSALRPRTSSPPRRRRRRGAFLESAQYLRWRTWGNAEQALRTPAAPHSPPPSPPPAGSWRNSGYRPWRGRSPCTPGPPRLFCPSGRGQTPGPPRCTPCR